MNLGKFFSTTIILLVLNAVHVLLLALNIILGCDTKFLYKSKLVDQGTYIFDFIMENFVINLTLIILFVELVYSLVRCYFISILDVI